MFIVFNQSKIKTYLLSLVTVVVLLVMAFMLTNPTDAIQTAASTKDLPIYNVATQDKKIAFTMNCAWRCRGYR